MYVCMGFTYIYVKGETKREIYSADFRDSSYIIIKYKYHDLITIIMKNAKQIQVILKNT